MKEIQIRNIFVDIFLSYYFQYAFNVSYAAMHINGKPSIDEVTLRRVFGSIQDKISRVKQFNNKNCAFLNLSGVLNLPIKEVYPVKFTLTTEEVFWFEFLINRSPEEMFHYCDESKNIRELRRLYAVPETYKEEFLNVFGNIKAIDLIRTRFVQGERIGNEPARTGYFIDSKTGIAHRV